MTSRPDAVVLTPLLGFPQVGAGDDLATQVLDALQDNGVELADGDVLVVSSKVVSKALGLTAAAGDKPAVVLGQSRRVVAERIGPGGVTRVVESLAGPVMTAAGVDASNTGADTHLLLLPADPDAAARDLLGRLLSGWADRHGTRPRLGLVLSDTAGRPWRFGQTDFALGSAGVALVDDLRGGVDADGRDLAVTVRCVGDEIAAAADLVKGKADGIPVAHLRGLSRHVIRTADPAGPDQTDSDDLAGSGARALVRTGPGDWFGLGRAEAVRAALGVHPGTERAAAAGIASTATETVADRADRAVAVALVDLPAVVATRTSGRIDVRAPSPFLLGVAAARIQVALAGEGLTADLASRADRATVTIGSPDGVLTAPLERAEPGPAVPAELG